MIALLLRSAYQARYRRHRHASCCCAGFRSSSSGRRWRSSGPIHSAAWPDLMPEFLQRGLGSKAMLLASFKGTVAFGYFHPVICVVVSVLAMYLATEVAHEVEAGLVDLELARAVPRHRLVTRSLRPGACRRGDGARADGARHGHRGQFVWRRRARLAVAGDARAPAVQSLRGRVLLCQLRAARRRALAPMVVRLHVVALSVVVAVQRRLHRARLEADGDDRLDLAVPLLSGALGAGRGRAERRATWPSCSPRPPPWPARRMAVPAPRPLATVQDRAARVVRVLVEVIR